MKEENFLHANKKLTLKEEKYFSTPYNHNRSIQTFSLQKFDTKYDYYYFLLLFLVYKLFSGRTRTSKECQRFINESISINMYLMTQFTDMGTYFYHYNVNE